MPGEVGPYQAQWNLRPRIDAMRTEAKSLHKDVASTFTERTTEIGIARDRAARDQYASEQAAKSADIQVGVERKAAAAGEKEMAALERRAAELERSGDRAAADEVREDAGKWAADRDAHVARARQAELDAAQLREGGAGHQRRVTELNVERADIVKQSTAVEKEVDKIDEQVQLLEQARLKYGEADMSTDTGKRASLELEAEALVTKADAIEVDRSIIRTVVPDLPETTPGIDDDPGPLPAGTEEVSATGPAVDDGTVASTDSDATGDGTESGTENTMSTTSDENDVRDETGVAAAARSANTLDDDDVFVDSAGGAMVGTSASDPSFGGDFGDGAGFNGPDSEATDVGGQADFDSTGAAQPAAAAYAETTAVEDTTGYERAGFDTGFENTGGYEAPAYEEPAPTYVEDSYASSDFSSPSEAETGYAEPSYDAESYEG